MIRSLPLLLLLAAVVGVPFLLRPKEDGGGRPDRTLVIISPHNEAIRYEFEVAFKAHARERLGLDVRIDWRTPGGVSEITRYLAGEYLAAFQLHWTRDLGRAWTGDVLAAFDNPKVQPDNSPGDDSPAEAARRAFLASDAGIGIDLFFGGGSFDFSRQAESGRLVDSGVLARRQDLFGPGGIPPALGGEAYWDPEGRWLGTCLSAFGISYNLDSLRRLGIGRPPTRWSDLADPKYLGQIALTDPTKSGSAAKAYEMLIQQQMHAAPDPATGWANAMRLLRRISGNARYFTDAGSKPAIDVSLGDAAAGMTIDFYGRFQAESVAGPDGTSRAGYVTPPGGSSVGSDPIGLLRGAKEKELAAAFIEFVLSPEAQRIWNFKLGAPGGPKKYALRRLPILKALYAPELAPFRSDPDVDAYADAAQFDYRGDWTGPLFNPIRLIVKSMCIDPADELREAWGDLIRAGFPPEATASFDAVGPVAYEVAKGPIRAATRSADKIEEVRVARDLGETFRANYRRASELARAGR
jgi:ABC-type Fe3+ transport system substrate-binding protein